MPCEERVQFVCDCVSRCLNPPEVLRSTSLVGMVYACGLSVGPVYGLEVRAWDDAEGVEVLLKV